MQHFSVLGRQIGGGAAPFVVAEIGINHGGNPDVAKDMVAAAAETGADAAKLQTFKTAKFLSHSSDYYGLLSSCELSPASVRELTDFAKELGIVLFSACFDEESADHLNDLGAPMFKVASGDLTHTPLLRHIAAFGKPMIVSTGAATEDEISAALHAIWETSCDLPIALLHCVSNYPTDPTDANLACIEGMRRRFQVPVGFSDHTLGNAVAIGAVALGAELIEKHFTLDRTMEGPDHALSSDPVEFKALVESVRMVHASIGRSDKAPVEAPEFIPQLRRSVTAGRDISTGTVITAEMLEIKRPGTGIQPAEMKDVIGRRAARDLKADLTLQWSDLE